MTVIRKLNIKCPICVAPFPSDVVLSTDLFRTLHTDLLEEAGGPEALSGLVHTCPACGYTGKRQDFDRPERARLEKIRARLGAEIGPQPTVDGIERWRLLGRVREIANDPASLVAEAYHCGAWCARLHGGAEREREMSLLAQALDAYRKALEPDEKPAGNHGNYAYQIAEISRRLGREEDAAAGFAAIEAAIRKDMLPKYNAALIRKLAAMQSTEPKDRIDTSDIPEPPSHHEE
jgi:uncharacterized protein (DUF2225 family)